MSQRDERWADIPLGTRGGATIGSHGCLLCAASKMTAFDPGVLNRLLCRNDGYTGGNRVIFSKLGELADLDTEVIECSDLPAPMDRVQDVLDHDGFVLAKVDFSPGGAVQQHWVQILGLPDGDALIYDPWLREARTCWMMPRYAHWSWDEPSRAIFRLALYTQRDKMADLGINAKKTGGSERAQQRLPPISKSPVSLAKQGVLSLRRLIRG